MLFRPAMSMAPISRDPPRGNLVVTLIATLAVCSTLAGTCAAHDFSRSESRVEIHGREVQVALSLNLRELGNVDTSADGVISYDELDRSIDGIYAQLKQHYILAGPAFPIHVTLQHYEISMGHVLDAQLLYVFPEDVTQLSVTSTLDQIMQHQIGQPAHQHLISVRFDGETRESVLDAAHPTAVFSSSPTSASKTFTSFVRLGIEHIFTGYDHLAFLIGLLIVTTTLGSMIKVITSFTVGHSLTLALATFNVVNIPVRWTESLIALSIGYVAAENLLGVGATNRYRIAFLFGLIHGFGFSNVLREMQLSRSHLALSLFSFNTGVEIGQILFVLVAFPLILYLARSRWRTQITSAVSVAILCLAAYWFVRRAFMD
jgi:HupE / UreJ protein